MPQTSQPRDTIYEYIVQQENAFRNPISLNDAWNWSMRDHVRLTVLYKNSQLSTGKTDFKPVKNITLPILRLQYRAEGFDVKDVELFVNDKDDYYKSFLVRKFHEKWARENGIDTFIDELVESYVDFGAALVKNLNQSKPEVVPMQSIVFCDQTDMLSGPIGIKHYYSPDQLLAMADKGWGKTSNGATISLEGLLKLARNEKKQFKDGVQTKTPGRYIEVYEIHGNLPKKFLNQDDTSEKYETRMYICAFYSGASSSDKSGVILYTAPEPESPFKLILRDKIYGRAIGMGGAEELFEAQVWTNYDMIRIQDMLDSAAKTLLETTDINLANKKVKEMDNLEIILHEPNTTIGQVNTFPVNMRLFEQSKAEWQEHAQYMGSATGALLGEMPTTHTAYNTIALTTSQGQAIHDYRRGQIATFVGEIYRDWVLPYIVKEIVKGNEFLAELDMDELQNLAESLVTCQANDMIKGKILNGETVDPVMVDTYKQQAREQFMKKGNKHFIEILKGELKDVPIDVEVSIANKQKDMGKIATELKGIVSFIFSTFNPATGTFAVFDDPRMAGILNQILEAAGLDQIDNYNKPKPEQPQGQQIQLSQQVQQPAQTPVQSPFQQLMASQPTQLTTK